MGVAFTGGPSVLMPFAVDATTMNEYGVPDARPVTGCPDVVTPVENGTCVAD